MHTKSALISSGGIEGRKEGRKEGKVVLGFDHSGLGDSQTPLDLTAMERHLLESKVVGASFFSLVFRVSKVSLLLLIIRNVMV